MHRQFRKHPGIYMIICLPNNRRYVGSSINIRTRIRDHLSSLKNGKHFNRYVQRSWNKYGEDNFKFTVLMYCNINGILIYEQKFINLLNDNDFNVAQHAGNRMGVKQSEETKKLISKIVKERGGTPHTQETKAYLSKIKKGVRQSEQHRINNGLSKIGIKLPEKAKMKLRKLYLDVPKSEEHKKNISKGKTGKPNYKLRGQKATVERKRKISESLKKYWAEKEK